MTEDNLYKKTDGVLFNYKTIKAEIRAIELEIEELQGECRGNNPISYEEKTGGTNAFNSSVENEVIKREKMIHKLFKEKNSKERLIAKIDNALEALDEEEKEIIKLRCFDKMSWSNVGSMISKDGNYCGQIKRNAIYKLSPLIFPSFKFNE